MVDLIIFTYHTQLAHRACRGNVQCVGAYGPI
jgi:hypothetical protein